MATHNTHNPLTGDGVTNTRNPLTGDKTGTHPPSGTNPITGRTKDGELGHHEQQYGANSGFTGPEGTQAHSTQNPLTGNGVNNTHNPLTGDNTTGRTNDGTLGHHDQQYGAGAATGLTGAQTHNTHNPLTGDGVNNTHNPLSGDKTGPNPLTGTNPVTGKTNNGELGRNEQYPAGAAGTTGTGYTGNDTVHDSTRGAHTATGTGVGTGTGTNTTHTGTGTGTDPHQTTQTSGGGAKGLIGKVEATLGSILKKPEMQAKGVQKQEDAAAAKAAKAEGATTTGTHTGAHTGTTGTGVHPGADPTNIPSHGHRTIEENLAAEAGPAGAGAGAGQMLGGGGRSAI